jgi:hypothetical protein
MVLFGRPKFNGFMHKSFQSVQITGCTTLVKEEWKETSQKPEAASILLCRLINGRMTLLRTPFYALDQRKQKRQETKVNPSTWYTQLARTASFAGVKSHRVHHHHHQGKAKSGGRETMRRALAT